MKLCINDRIHQAEQTVKKSPEWAQSNFRFEGGERYRDKQVAVPNKRLHSTKDYKDRS